jgi:hypothetical protein
MTFIRQLKIFFWTALPLLVWAVPTDADIIYFNDGMKTICQERAWEEGEEIKCEYDGWILTYQKKDVQQIIKTIPDIPPAEQGSEETQQTPTVQTDEPDKQPKTAAPIAPGGIAFYDPRRPFKYWTSPTAKHHSFQEAVETLAQQYQRSPEWIQSHMGDTNDLDQIHANLANPEASDHNTSMESAAEKSPTIEFYNPRRTYPYWTSETSRYKTFKEAIDDLSKTYDSAPEWIQENMGATNDLDEIHRNLKTKAPADLQGS